MSNPLINQGSVKYPEELTPEFYAEPVEVRDKPHKLLRDYQAPPIFTTDQLAGWLEHGIGYTRLLAVELLNLVDALTEDREVLITHLLSKLKKHCDDRIDAFLPQLHHQYLASPLNNAKDPIHSHLWNLEVPGKRVGLHVSVEELPGRDEDYNFIVPLGHHHYSFHNTSRVTYWTSLKEPWYQSVRDQHTAGSGLPMCIFEQMNSYKLQEYFRVKCPASSPALQGMTREFLADLGITDERVINGEATLIFTAAFVY